MYTTKPLSGQKGMALALTLFLLLILVMGGSLFFIASQTELKHGNSYTRRIEALSVAESAAERALWKLQSEDLSAIGTATWNTNFGGDTNFIPIGTGQYMRVSYPETIFSGEDATGYYSNLKIIATGMLGREEGGKVIPISTKKIEIIVKVNRTAIEEMPRVFDYAYFINNWGWWHYGNGVAFCRGSMKSNGNFEIKGTGVLTIDGSVESQLEVDYNGRSPNGLAGLRSGPPAYNNEPYKRSNLPKENIPNLQDMSYYKKIAQGWNPDTDQYDHPAGTIRIGSRTFTSDGVFDGSSGEGSSTSLILIGTKNAPIEITNSVVIEGNLIIKGSVSVTGSDIEHPRYGSIYVGRNAYIAGNIQYVNGPNWGTYPLWQQSAGTDYKNPANSIFNITNNDDGLPSKSGTSIMDTWVGNNSTKTLLSVSAKGGLVYGNYSSSNWIADEWLFDNPKRKGMGSEDVGADGIPNTNVHINDGTPNGTWTDPTEGNGVFEPTTEDLDGDKSFDGTYTWTDVTVTGSIFRSSGTLTTFEGLRKPGTATGPLWDPTGIGTITQYSQTATNMISTIDGVYYTQHFLAGRVANSPNFHGSLISKDEAIVYSGILDLKQDTRYHSNYRQNPNFPIYLFPPGSVSIVAGSETLGKLQKVISWKEVR
ncbi:MAG: hypothetical protein ABH886_01710 [Candidatus Desantisbacteria bacterium]